MLSATGRHGGIQQGRLRVALVTGLVVWAIVILRLATIQLVRAPGLVEYAEDQHIEPVNLAADRGTIYDRNMMPLTDNLSVQSVCANPREIDSPSSVARQLVRTLGGSYDDYLTRLKRDKGFVWIRRQVSPSSATALRALDLPGIGFLPESKRVHLLGETACHVVGMTDIDGVGLSGIEKEMDELLTGAEATVYYCLDSAGRRTPTPAYTKVVPRDGMSVVLTIDSHLQSIVEVELERGIRKHNGVAGIAIVQDPWTGEILAMANWPTFDPDRPELYSMESRKNRAITDQFEPGSTFKLVTAAAALSTGSADLGSVYYACRGSKDYGRFTIHDVKEHGWLDFEHAFAKSSNVCFAEVAYGVGAIPLYSFARDFGFGCLTGISLPGEVRGMLREPGEWSPRSVPTIGIGQEVAVTALQLVGAYSAIANGGYLMEPKVIRSILADDGRVVEDARWSVVRQVAEPDVAATLKELLACATEYGTGKNARVAEMGVSGKTGTAQKVASGSSQYDPGKWVSSFVGMAPADDPQLVCLVVIDEPDGRGLGGEVAAPVFAKIMERIVRGPGHEYVLRGRGDYVESERKPGRLDRTASGRPSHASDAGGGVGRWDAVPASASGGLFGGRGRVSGSEVIDSAYAGLVRTGRGGIVVAPAIEEDETEVPDFRGMSVRLARQTAAARGLTLTFRGNGRVTEQSPGPGRIVSSGHRVEVRCCP
ncbi:MAG: penicillin-binding protein [Candidatus Eisenbacteria bacterium]